MKQRINGLFTGIVKYIKTHISAPMTGAVLLLLLLTGIIMQAFVKNQYFEYLLSETKNTERAVMEASASNINSTLKEALNTACKIAIDSTLRTLAENVQESDGYPASGTLTLKRELNMVSHYAENIVAVTIVSGDGVLLEYGRYWSGGGYANLWEGDNEAAVNELYQQVMDRMTQNGATRYCVATSPSMHPGLPGTPLFHIALPLLGKSARLDNVQDVLVLTFRLNKVISATSIANDKQEKLAEAYMADEDGTIIYHEDAAYVGKSAAEYQNTKKGQDTIDQKLDYFGWSACIVIDTAGIRQKVDRMYGQSVIIYLILLVICAIIWRFLFRLILHPISEIRKAMSEIRLDGNRSKIEVRGSHELWQLADSYNEMVDTLAENQEELKRYYHEKTLSIEQKNKAKREALESQINAHFLCNTLTAINYNAIDNGDEEVAALLKKLSMMLSYTFSRNHEYVTLGQEIQWVEQYLYLQKFRLMDVFDYEIIFQQEYSEWPCCKLFLQPFVENSVLHGFEGREHGGKIEIRGTIERKRYRIEVSDNGCGMPAETEQLIQGILQDSRTLDLNGTGIGIQNAVTRLRMYYGENLAITMRTRQGEGTAFTFWLPIPRQKAE